MASPQTVMVQPAVRVRGRVRPPGDKAVSHRFAILASLADGPSVIRGYSTGWDPASTVACLRALGVHIETIGVDDSGLQLRVDGRGLGGWTAAGSTLDAGNSGSTMRMLAGALAAHGFTTTIAGDASLERRPMGRVIVPLERMGARIASIDGRPPLTIHGTAAIRPITFQPEVASAQVKTAVLLAGLHAEGTTHVLEPLPTRDHTERALRTFGAAVDEDAGTIGVRGRQRLTGTSVDVPGDISSAAFWMVAAAALPGSEILLDGVGLNPSRMGIVTILRRMGADIDVDGGPPTSSEPIGRIIVRHAGLRPAVIVPEDVPGVIDELPVLAALATHGGELRVTGAQELRHKESDRISALAEGLRRMGGDIDEQPDGFHVRGRMRLRGGDVDAQHDHRLAMAFAIAALGATGPTTIHDAAAAAVSYPEFFSVLESLRA